MYEINRCLVERKADRSFFDASRFFVFKFNPNGYAIIEALATGQFSRERFVMLCDDLEMPPESMNVFWDKCIRHGIVVEFGADRSSHTMRR